MVLFIVVLSTNNVTLCDYNHSYMYNEMLLQRRELEYDEYLKDRLVKAKNEFKALLRETKTITYKSYAMFKESDKHEKDIIDVLKVHKKYMCVV